MQRTYRVSFFKRLVDSYGHRVDPCQGVVEVRAADQDRAIELARQQFAELKDVAHWSLRADYEKVELPEACKRTLRRVRRAKGAE